MAMINETSVDNLNDNPEKKIDNNSRFNRQLIVHFYRIFQLLNIGHLKWNYLNILFLFFLSSIEELIIFQIGLITAKFYYILLLNDINQFYQHLLLSFSLVLFMSLIKSAKIYVSTVISIEWREQLSKNLIEHYFENFHYYYLNIMDKNANFYLDNIDQRLSQDIEKLSSQFSTTIANAIVLPLTIIYYSYQVASTIGISGVFICFLLFFLSTFFNKFPVHQIVKWTYRKEKEEGNYRAELINVKNFSENIAFTNSEVKVKNTLLKTLTILLSAHENLALKQFYLNILTTIFNYSGTLVSFIIISIPIFRGTFAQMNKAELSSQISSNTFFCLYLINCFSKIIDLTANFATINGIGYRLTEMKSAFKSNKNNEDNKYITQFNSNNLEENIFLQMDNVCIRSIYSGESIGQLTFELKKNENLFIKYSGRNNENAILKVLKGLWPISSGSILINLNVNNFQEIMFISANINHGYYLLQVMNKFFFFYLTKFNKILSITRNYY